MAYERQTWECGETITAEKLNHMEEGISSASGGGTPLIVNDVNETLDKTWQEIHDAFVGGQIVIVHGDAVDELVASVKLYNGYYLVTLAMGTTYGASSASDYPEIHVT